MSHNTTTEKTEEKFNLPPDFPFCPDCSGWTPSDFFKYCRECQDKIILNHSFFNCKTSNCAACFYRESYFKRELDTLERKRNPPANLQTLEFGSNFNQPLNSDALFNSLQTLNNIENITK